APESLLANKMMKRLLQEKRSLAIVVDEFGGTSGMVTLEDLVEEIFGDIEDEHDKSRIIARQLPDGSYEFSGRIETERLHDEFDIDIPQSDDYQTLAGYLLFSTGTIPTTGSEVVLPPYVFTISKSTATRLELINVRSMPDEP
ncbi:MAG: hemolysin, partial [Muribaculaceae bacterium]|nr:hemolysin [Muribaculaceae bacterium]